MNKLFAVSIFGSLILGACASPENNLPQKQIRLAASQICKYSNEVIVRIFQASGGSAVIVTNPDPLCPHPGPEVELTWKILPENSPYVFSKDDGITIVGGETVFRCWRDRDPHVFKCINKNTKGTYKYNIKVVSGEKTLASDPIIINGFVEESLGLPN
jgi:hypothetical protein